MHVVFLKLQFDSYQPQTYWIGFISTSDESMQDTQSEGENSMNVSNRLQEQEKERSFFEHPGQKCTIIQ